MTVSRSLVRWYCISASAATISKKTNVRNASAISRRQRPSPLKLSKLNHHITGSSPSSSRYHGLLKSSIARSTEQTGFSGGRQAESAPNHLTTSTEYSVSLPTPQETLNQ